MLAPTVLNHDELIDTQSNYNCGDEEFCEKPRAIGMKIPATTPPVLFFFLSFNL